MNGEWRRSEKPRSAPSCVALYSATNPQSLKARIDCGYELGEDEAAFGLGDGPAEHGVGFDPLLDDDFDVGEGIAVGFTVHRAAGEFRDLGDESLVLRAPVNDDLILGLRHRARLPNRISVWKVITTVRPLAQRKRTGCEAEAKSQVAEGQGLGAEGNGES